MILPPLGEVEAKGGRQSKRLTRGNDLGRALGEDVCTKKETLNTFIRRDQYVKRFAGREKKRQGRGDGFN